MLILSRKLEESIRIGDGIVVKVVAVQDGQVKLGIEAPKDVRILRSELYDETQKSNTQAASADRAAVLEAAKRFARQSAPEVPGAVKTHGRTA